MDLAVQAKGFGHVGDLQGAGDAVLPADVGPNDVGGVLMDEMVVRAAGIDNRATAANMRRIISNAGFRPRERDGLYNTLKSFEK